MHHKNVVLLADQGWDLKTMRGSQYVLLLGVGLAIAGFALGAFLGQRQLGAALFLTGFFVGGGSAVYSVLSARSAEFGPAGRGIKIIFAGFGLALLGGLASLVNESELPSYVFRLGLLVIVTGIVIVGVGGGKR